MNKLEKLEAEHKRLGEEIENMKKKDWPQVGDEFHFVNEDGDVSWSTYKADEVDKIYRNNYNVFPTKEKANA